MVQSGNDLTIREFQRNLFHKYCRTLKLPSTYKYLYGNPVQPVVPLDTHQGGVLILGAYPSAKFAAIQNERDVPVADNCGPFSNEE